MKGRAIVFDMANTSRRSSGLPRELLRELDRPSTLH
jgi:hypothetical protein